MKYSPEKLLTSAGFLKVYDTWNYHKMIYGQELIVVVKESGSHARIFTGKIQPVGTWTAAEIFNFEGEGFYYTSPDVADMLALAHNERGLATAGSCRFAYPPFEDEKSGKVISAPFTLKGEGPRDFETHGYATVRSKRLPQGKTRYELKDPKRSFKGYGKWKDLLIQDIIDWIEHKGIYAVDHQLLDS